MSRAADFPLTEDEYQELLALEYVLTWNYTDNHERDELRYKKLSDRMWEWRERNYKL